MIDNNKSALSSSFLACKHCKASLLDGVMILNVSHSGRERKGFLRTVHNVWNSLPQEADVNWLRQLFKSLGDMDGRSVNGY